MVQFTFAECPAGDVRQFAEQLFARATTQLFDELSTFGRHIGRAFFQSTNVDLHFVRALSLFHLITCVFGFFGFFFLSLLGVLFCFFVYLKCLLALAGVGSAAPSSEFAIFYR